MSLPDRAKRTGRGPGLARPHIEAAFSRRSLGDVAALMEDAGIANAVLNDVAAVVRHAQLEARGRWTTVESFVGEIPALLPPHNIAGVSPSMGRVPALGEHTEEVLGR